MAKRTREEEERYKIYLTNLNNRMLVERRRALTFSINDNAVSGDIPTGFPASGNISATQLANFSDLGTINIIKTNGVYTTDFDFGFNKALIAGTEKWIDVDTGVDDATTGRGNSSGMPYKTLAYAYAQGGRRFHVKSGNRFTLPNGFNGSTTLSAAHYIDIYGGTEPIYLTSAVPLLLTAFAQDVTHTNTYVSTYSGALSIGSVFDFTNKDSNGVVKRLTKVASAAICNVTPGSYFYDTTPKNIYVRTWDSRPVDSDVWCCEAQSAVLPTKNAAHTSRVHYEDVHVYGGTAADVRGGAAGNRRNVVFRRCAFAGEDNGSLYGKNFTNIYLDNCIAAYGLNDGYNYIDTCRAFENNCRAYQNAFDNAGDGNNGTTGHGNSRTIALNGSYLTSKGKAIQYIENSMILAVNCVAGDSLAAEGDEDTAAYASTSVVGATGYMTMVECRAQGRVTDLKVWNLSAGVMNIYDGALGNLLTDMTKVRQDSGSTLNVLSASQVFS